MTVIQQRRSQSRHRRQRYQPTAAYALVDTAKRKGIGLDDVPGPWRVGGRALPRRGRNDLPMIPLVTNGRTEVMVDTLERAAELSAFLNWCGIEDLNPVSDLRPPRFDIH
jgi:hypothetical protein